MKKRAIAWLIVLAVCLSSVPALAANVFLFTDKVIKIFEGETYQTKLRREGNYAGDGEIDYTVGRSSVATISRNGMLTGIGKGRTEITATLTRNGKRVGAAKATVNVLRAVDKVTLNTSKLSVYDPEDPAVTGLLKEPTEYQVLVVPAGGTAVLTATCTPEDASSLKVTFATNDAGVAKIQGNSLKAIQRGECDLVVASVQNPEITETFRVLVIQPVKSIRINAGDKKVAAGSRMQLSAACAPSNASIQNVTWLSKNPNVATVDRNGVVTGLKKGTAIITATAADGSNAVGTVTLTVTQSVTSISMQTSVIQVVNGRTVTAKATALPAEANDKTITWTTDNPSIATVRGNSQSCQVTGVKAGTCTLIATSKSNPEVRATATIVVSQLVTGITNVNSPAELSFKVGESVQTRWNVLPADATNKTLTFKSNSTKVATVDDNGLVRGQSRGIVTITATAKDAGRKQGTVKVSIIQPVTGVNIKRARYYIQRNRYATLRAEVQPRNANNQNVSWTTDNEYIATVVPNSGKVFGVTSGSAMITACTEDGGYMASTEVRIGDWIGTVAVLDVHVDANNKIRITMRNMNPQMTIRNIRFAVECFDMEGNPMICNKDGESTKFEGSYPYLLRPYEQTIHGSFNFGDYQIDQTIGGIVIRVLSWSDEDGYPFTYMQGEEPSQEWHRLYNNPNLNPDEGVG